MAVIKWYSVCFSSSWECQEPLLLGLVAVLLKARQALKRAYFVMEGMLTGLIAVYGFVIGIQTGS